MSCLQGHTISIFSNANFQTLGQTNANFRPPWGPDESSFHPTSYMCDPRNPTLIASLQQAWVTLVQYWDKKRLPLTSNMREKGRADSRLAPSQWETSLQSNTVSHWLGANLESTLERYTPIVDFITENQHNMNKLDNHPQVADNTCAADTIICLREMKLC